MDRRPSENGSGPGAGPGTPGYRLPAPVRERRPALAALAVLLIVGGALASALIVMRSGQRSDYLVIRGNVPPGQQIRSSDLGVASIAGSGASAIPAGRRASIVGEYATAQLYSGTLATASMFSPESSVANHARIGLLLSDQQRPAATPKRGDMVEVFLVPRSDSASGTGTVLIPATQVVDVGDESDTSNGLPVSVLVDSSNAAAVAGYAANGRVGIAELPPSTRLQLVQPSASTGAGGGIGGTGTGTGGTGVNGQGTALRTPPRGANAQLGRPTTRR